MVPQFFLYVILLIGITICYYSVKIWIPVSNFVIQIPGFSSSALLEYLNWRENIFYSSDCDTSLMQMLPCWFPKTVRRLVQLYIEVS